MGKVRIYEIAKELGVENVELVTKISSMGIQVRNHMSALEQADADRVKRAFQKDSSKETVEERIRPTVVRRRAVARKEPKAEAPAETDTTAGAKDESSAPQNASEAVPESKPPTQRPAVAAAAKAPARKPESSQPPAVSAPPQSRANLPLGVVARGNAVAPGAPQQSPGTVSRILSEHSARSSDAPRRREVGRAALGSVGRQMSNRPGRRKQAPTKKSQKTEITTPSAAKRLIKIEDQVTLQVLSQRMSLKSTDVLMKLVQLGMTNVNINSSLDADTAAIIAQEFGYEVENVAKSDDEMVSEARGEYENKAEDRLGRPPVVTVMGHVDHGKTSLLDSIRSTSVADREAGGITQHIGAYRVDMKQGTVVFLDTPGHEAFTSMRARGAQVTDVVILVAAADDGVMPQTREALNHAKDAGVPLVVAINKIDKEDAQPEIVKRDLAAEGLQPEEWGGETQFIEVSAKTGKGIDELLKSVLLQAEMLELKANPKIPAEGVVLESYLDKGRGPVANILVSNGTLKTGDTVLAGNAWGKVRAMTNDRGKQVNEAGPATPVEVLGLSEMPAAGESFFAVTDQKRAQELAEDRKRSQSKGPTTLGAKGGLEQLYQMMQSGEVQELKLVVKADVHGSVEAIVKALTELSTDKVRVNVIHTGVGGITENDVMLASASKAVIVGFNVRPAGNASSTAKSESVDMRLYKIIYEAVDEVKQAMTGLLKPTLVEKNVGKAEVRETFGIPKIGTIAGCYVLEGKFSRNAKIRVVRDSVTVWEGPLKSLRRFKDDVREVASGYECGIGLDGFNDVKTKDVLECFETEEVAAQL